MPINGIHERANNFHPQVAALFVRSQVAVFFLFSMIEQMAAVFICNHRKEEDALILRQSYDRNNIGEYGWPELRAYCLI
ncbi:hypothetical protein CAP48_07225 [Advenella sp. S44]|nr:hypothetical protein CAP48_07225 [Advenella sp. S44]